MLTGSDWEPIVRMALEETNKAINRLVEKFSVKLKTWLNEILNHPIPEDWRDELADFVRRTADEDNLAIAPHSVAALERLIESHAVATGGTRARTQAVAVRRTPDANGALNAKSSQGRVSKQRFMLAADKRRAKPGYRTTFKEATPEMPNKFQVHHIVEQGRDILAERFHKELKINLDDLDNLRGVPDKIHGEITAIQSKFWAAQAKEQGGDLKEAYKRVSLGEVQKLQAEIEATYKSFWVKAGATAEEVAAVEKRLNNKRLMNLRPARIEGTLKNAGMAITGFAIFTFLADAAALAINIADPPPEVQSALDEMLTHYARLYEIRSTQGSITKNQWAKLQEATMKYLKVAGFDDKTKAAVLYELEIEGSKLP
jgi:hypothetical protein